MALRCLIVDDNARFAEAARVLLEREGMSVVVVGTSAEGFRKAQELRPDVALVDIDLGADDGFDLARRLAASQCTASVRVVLMSAHDGREFAEAISESAAVGFVPKTHLSAEAIYRLLGESPDVPRTRSGT